MENIALITATFALAAAPPQAPSEQRVSLTEQVVQERVETDHGAVRVVRVAGGLEHPWALAWLPDGSMLVTERPGRLQLISDGSVREVAGLPPIDTDEDQKTAPQGGNQGGLLDVAVHPGNGYVYFTYSSPGDRDGVPDADRATGTALARARLAADGSGLTDVEVLYAQSPRHTPGRHYGSRIVFPDDDTVVFSIGDRGLRGPSQDLTDPSGSMIRLHDDGRVHEDNPFVGMAPGNLRPEILSFGHRNNQAMALHPETGELWTAEHGPRGGDYLHVVEPGANHGWPVVSFGVDYSTGEPIGVGETAPGIREPVYVWHDAIAPSGMTFYDGDAFAGWNGSLFVGSLLQERLHRLELGDGEVVGEEVLLEGVVGRIRDVRQGPDGFLYVVTDEQDGGIYRIEPIG